MNLALDLMSAGATAAGEDADCLISDCGTLTFGGMRDLTTRLAAGLNAHGVTSGQRVLLAVGDTLALPPLLLATIAIGAVAVVLQGRDLDTTLDRIRRLAGEAIVVTGDERLLATPGKIPTLRYDDLLAVSTSRGRGQPVDLAPDSPAFWVMTSGTTGEPRAVEHGHRAVLGATGYLAHTLGVDPGDRLMSTSRLNHAYPLGVLFGALGLGAATVILEDWPRADRVLSAVKHHRPQVVFSVPTLYRKMAESRGLLEAPPSSVRAWVSAGERLPPALADDWRRLVGAPILDGMGCSESLYMIFANAPKRWRVGAAGRVAPGADVRLVTDDGSLASAGTSGHLDVRAPWICLGYREPSFVDLRRPEDQFRGEWFRTGDLFRADPAGFFHHEGRADDMLRIASNWIAPSAIEDTLCDLPKVREAAAVQSRSRDGLLQVSLFVVPAFDVTADNAVEAALRRVGERLPPAHRPRQAFALEALPRTPNGKVRRRLLRELAATLSAENVV